MGGYEVCNAFRIYGNFQRPAPEAETVILDAAKAMLDSVHGLQAEVFASGFPTAHDTYNGLGHASNGDVYYVLCSCTHDVPGKMYRLAAATGGASTGQAPTPELIADLSTACGDVAASASGSAVVAQGKSHVPFFEDAATGRLYFATHVGFYTMVDGMETLPVSEGQSAANPAHEPSCGGCPFARLPVCPFARLPVCRG